ncbi:MAG: hypothetical protein ACPG1A_08085 [Halioglobus sp.]
MRAALVTIVICLFLGGCVSQSVNSTSVPSVRTAGTQVSEALLLDVGVTVFNPGIADYDVYEDEQIYPEVRRAESLFMAGQLARAMAESAAWGAVRVVPDDTHITDLKVHGEIRHSDGEQLELHIVATDSRGAIWLDKTYRDSTSRYAYEMTTRNTFDPFQKTYNDIANDLLHTLEQLTAADREDVRLVTELLFARSFSPDAFDGYLQRNPQGKYLVMRLPANNDPMLERVRRIRERDHMYVDTLQQFYSDFDEQMEAPYDDWRKASYEQTVALREAKAESTRELVAGAIAIIAGMTAAIGGDQQATRAAGSLGVYSGGYLLKSGLAKRQAAQIHVSALEELGTSLETEIAPQVIELEDRTITLSGNVEEQFDQWRDVLAEIYRAEVGDLEPLPAADVIAP